MVMVKATWVSLLALAAFLLVVLVPAAEAVTCSPMQLSPCAAAITSSSPPSAVCCAKLKEQKPCICGYMRNPSLRRYISSPNARKVSNTCKFPMPRCWKKCVCNYIWSSYKLCLNPAFGMRLGMLIKNHTLKNNTVWSMMLLYILFSIFLLHVTRAHRYYQRLDSSLVHVISPLQVLVLIG